MVHVINKKNSAYRTFLKRSFFLTCINKESKILNIKIINIGALKFFRARARALANARKKRCVTLKGSLSRRIKYIIAMGIRTQKISLTFCADQKIRDGKKE